MPIRWVQRDGFTPYLALQPILSREVEGVRPVAPISPVRPSEGKESPRPVRLREAYQPPTQPRRSALLASQVMTAPVVTIVETEPLTRAGSLMQEKGFRHLPVVSTQDRLVGLLSERDLLRGLPLKGKGPPPPPWKIRQVRDLMSPTLLTATPDTPLKDIARVMEAERIGCLPLLNGRGRLVGILTTTDLLRCILREVPVDLWT